jgi:hypothetical protein
MLAMRGVARAWQWGPVAEPQSRRGETSQLMVGSGRRASLHAADAHGRQIRPPHELPVQHIG